MLPEYRIYYVRGEDGLEYGPVEMDELREWVRENRAGLGTSVRLDEKGEPWQPWQNYPELVALLAEASIRKSAPISPHDMVIAPIWKRLAAFMVDFFFLTIFFMPIRSMLNLFLPVDHIEEVSLSPTALAVMPSPEFHQVVAFTIIMTASIVLYFAWFYARHGQTPAKALLRLRVVDEKGNKPNMIRSLLRAAIFVFSCNLLFFPMTSAFFNPQRRTLHDFVAGTYVVET